MVFVNQRVCSHRVFLLFLLFLTFSFAYTQQAAWQCGTPDAPPPSGVTGSCTNDTDWNFIPAYRPYNQDMRDLTVKVNFIFWETEDPITEWDGTVSHGNFDLSNPDHAAYLNLAINDLNARIGDLNFPNESQCLNANDLDLGQYLQFGKIQFDVEMYFIQDTYLWDITNATSSGCGGNPQFYCPNSWCDEYTDRVYQKLTQANVRNAINCVLRPRGTGLSPTASRLQL